VSLRTGLVVILALVFGLSAAVGINSIRDAAPAAEAGEKVAVLMMSADVPRGKSITPDLLTTRDYPKDLVPPGALSRAEDALDRTVLVPLVKDEPLLESKLASRSAGRGLAPLIPEGMRACTITTNIASSVAGFIVPGNHVDVLLTITNNGATDASGGASTTTLLQNVEILAVDNHVDAPADNKADPNLRSVTLLVNQSQAAKLALGQNRGTLQLTLRSTEDHKDGDAKPATLAEVQINQKKSWDERLKEMFAAASKSLANKPDQPVAAPAEPEMARIRTLRGTQDGMVYVEQSEPRVKGQ
jgi:pilus assembly protein CpaB